MIVRIIIALEFILFCILGLIVVLIERNSYLQREALQDFYNRDLYLEGCCKYLTIIDKTGNGDLRLPNGEKLYYISLKNHKSGKEKWILPDWYTKGKEEQKLRGKRQLEEAWYRGNPFGVYKLQYSQNILEKRYK